MTPAKLRKLISILKVDGTNQILYDAIKYYIEEIYVSYPRHDLAEITQEISKMLMTKYKLQLPNKVARPKSKQVDLEDSIIQIQKEKLENQQK